jgi:hypothetical protein
MMPSHYAHYRFGTNVIPMLPLQAQRSVRQFRRLFDAGLHGPDIFFYHNFFFPDNVVALAKKYHGLTGEDFFVPVCKRLRLEPSEAAMAYLWGVLTHYCLDSVTHGFVLEQTHEGKVGHVEMETEFDRFLLQLDGKRQPNTFDCSGHIKLTGGECETVSKFYDTTPLAVNVSIKAMASGVKILAMPNGNLRRTVEKYAGSRLRQHFMGRLPNKNCAHLNEPMLQHYNRALEVFPAMVEALTAHMTHNAPLGELFEPTFNG